jgi:hypothetical protein
MQQPVNVSRRKWRRKGRLYIEVNGRGLYLSWLRASMQRDHAVCCPVEEEGKQVLEHW